VNNYYNLQPFVFPYLAHTLAFDAIEAILADKGFLISSPQAASARACDEKLHTYVGQG